MLHIPVVPLACANWTSSGATACTSKGTAQCSRCKLVAYCGTECQKAHWPDHKKACKSPLSKSNWRPAWDRECRDPAWASGDVARNFHNPFGGTKYLWGNVPAIDILQLEQNEGIGRSIALLFAASGDLRNVVKTVTNLPEDFASDVQVTINDWEFQVVARNAILLLFALVSLDEEQMVVDIAENLIHIWYSAFIPAQLLSSIQSRVGSLITAVCADISDLAPGAVCAKTWKFRSGCKLDLKLQKQQWLRLERYTQVPKRTGYNEAKNLRSATVLAPERADYRDRWHYKDTGPSMRIAKQRFREDELLLPFGHPRLQFDTPNPTLFQTPDAWPMDDKADPLNGWSIDDVNSTSTSATQDLYGKVFLFLRNEFSNFLNRIASVKIDFQMYHMDVRHLPPQLEENTYSRIEVSNITDPGPSYVGTETTLRLLVPLLQTPQQNPHATIITSYLNATMTMVKRSSEHDQSAGVKAVLQYMTISPETLLFNSMQSAAMYKIWDARNLVLDRDKFFNRFMVLQDFRAIATAVGVEMKTENTVVAPWPTALKLRLGQKGAGEEFEELLASNFSGLGRYVEWKRVE